MFDKEVLNERRSERADWEVIPMNTEKKNVSEQKATMTIRYGKTLYKVIFRFAEKGNRARDQ